MPGTQNIWTAPRTQMTVRFTSSFPKRKLEVELQVTHYQVMYAQVDGITGALRGFVLRTMVMSSNLFYLILLPTSNLLCTRDLDIRMYQEEDEMKDDVIETSSVGSLSLSEPWMTVVDVRDYLSLPSKQAVYEAVRAGQLPVHRLGHRLRFRKTEIDDVLLRD